MLLDPALDQGFSQPSLLQYPTQETDTFYTASKSGSLQVAALDMHLGWGNPNCVFMQH